MSLIWVFRVNTAQPNLVDRAPGPGLGEGSTGRLVGSLRSAGYTPEESISFWSAASIPITSAAHDADESGSFPMPMLRARPKATFGCRRIAARRRGCATFFPECESHRSAVHQCPVKGTVQCLPSPSSTACNRPRLVPPGSYRYKVSSKGQKFCLGRHHPCKRTNQASRGHSDFDIDQRRLATRNQCCLARARRMFLIAAPHTSLFPALVACARRELGISWVSGGFTYRWDE